MKQNELVQAANNAGKSAPNLPFVIYGVSLELVTLLLPVFDDEESDKIIEVEIRYSFDIQVNACICGRNCSTLHDVDFTVENRLGSQRVVVLYCGVIAGSTSWAKSMGKLGDGKDTFGIEVLDFFLSYAANQAQMIEPLCLLPTEH